MKRPTYTFSVKFDKDKKIKTKEGKEKKALSFAKLNGYTESRLFVDSIYSEENNRNDFILLDWSGLNVDNSRAKSILVDDNHRAFLGEEGASYFPDTHLQNLYLYLNSAGYKDIYGEIVSSNPDFVEYAEKATGVSVVLEAPDFSEWFLVEIPMASGKTKEIVIAQSARIQSITLLHSGVEAGSGGSRIGGKEFTTQGSRAAPLAEETEDTTSHFNNLKKIKMTEEDVKKIVSNSIKEGLEAFKKEEEEAKKVTFSILKEEVAEGKEVEIDGQKFTLSKVVDSNEDKEEEDLKAFSKKIEETQSKAKENSKAFTKKVGEGKEEKTITFETL